jgi:hypothetical protein
LQFKIGLASLTLAVSCATVAQTPAGNLTKGFVGRWAGQVQIQDSSNLKAIDPMWLTITETPDHKSLELDAIPYDSSGPASHRSTLITFDRDTAKATFGTSGKPLYTPGTYNLQGLEDFEKNGRGTLILTGTDTEKGEPIDVRIVLTLQRNLYTFTKKFDRHGSEGHKDSTSYEIYSFTRDSPISPKGKPFAAKSEAQKPVQTPGPSQPQDLNANFVGNWVGHVAYQDADGKLKKHPTYLKMEEVRRGKTLRMDFTFDDGKSELDRDRRFITIMPQSSELKLEWDHQPLLDHTYSLNGLQDFSKTGYGILIFTGTMKESGVMTDLRYTLILEKEGLLVYQRETRPEGKQQFEIRNRYLFTRDDPPRNIASSAQTQELAK